jgi:hypothetical protein
MPEPMMTKDDRRRLARIVVVFCVATGIVFAVRMSAATKPACGWDATTPSHTCAIALTGDSYNGR